MRESFTPAFVTPSTPILHARTTLRAFNRCHKPPTKMRTKALSVRHIRPSAMRKILPVLATAEQTMLHLGNSRYAITALRNFLQGSDHPKISAILDRVLAAVLLLIVLHLFPGMRILTLLKLIAVAWPLLQPFLRASARNARLRKGAAYVVRGSVCVIHESGKNVLFVDGVQTGIPVQQNVEGVGYGLVVRGRLRAVWCDGLFYAYPYVNARRMRRLVHAFGEG